MLDLGNSTPTVLFVDPAAQKVVFTLCSSNCDTSSPTWTTPINLGNAPPGSDQRPILEFDGNSLFGAWATGTGVSYFECANNCDQLSSWNSHEVIAGRPGSIVSATDWYNNTHGAVLELADAGVAYAECGNNCAGASSVWSVTGLGVAPASASMWLTTSGSNIRREVAVGEANGTLRYMECRTSSCPSTGWTGVDLGTGYAPSLVDDGNNDLPHLFYNTTGAGTGGIAFAYCTTRSNGGCTNIANWIQGVALVSDGFVIGGSYPSSSTWFLTTGTTANGQPIVGGWENGSGGYDLYTFVNCSGTKIPGLTPSAYIDDNYYRLKMVYRPPGTNGLSLYYEPP